jgi:hypothetical protein
MWAELCIDGNATRSSSEELKGNAIGDGSVHLAARRAARKVEITAWQNQRRGLSVIDGTVPMASAK